MNENVMILAHSMRNLWSLWHKKLTAQFPTVMIVPTILRAYVKLESGQSIAPIYLDENSNVLWKTSTNPDTTQKLIGDNDGFIAVGWKQMVKKVDDNDFAGTVPYPFAKSDLFNAAPVGAASEFSNIHGLMRYSQLELRVSDKPALTNLSSEIFYDVPPALLAAANNDVVDEDQNFESFKPIGEILGFYGNVKNSIHVSTGGGLNTLAGDVAESTEQNYYGFHILGFMLKDQSDVVKGLVDGQNRCQLP